MGHFLLISMFGSSPYSPDMFQMIDAMGREGKWGQRIAGVIGSERLCEWGDFVKRRVALQEKHG